MHVKSQLNRNNKFIKTVITKKKLNYINLQLAIRIVTPFRHESPNYPYLGKFLDQIGSADLLEPRFKDISTDDGRTDGRLDGRTDRHRE